MIRSVLYRLYPNPSKQDSLSVLMDKYQQAVNHYINQFIINLPKYRTNCYKDCDSSILPTKRLEDNAAMTAYDVVLSWTKRRKREANTPVYRGGIRVNVKGALVCCPKKAVHFDRWLRVPALKLDIPFNLYKHKWIKEKELKDLVIIHKNNKWYVKVSYELDPIPIQYENEITSIDVGINKLFATPYHVYGTKTKRKMKYYVNKIRELRKRLNKQGLVSSKQLDRLEERLSAFMKNTYNREIKKLIDQEKPKTIIVEKLNIKGTKGKRSKSFNNRVSRIGLSGIKKLIQLKCEEHGIAYYEVNPAYTSQTCPHCGHVDRKNRNNEQFKCVNCGAKGDADRVASINILRTFLKMMEVKKNKGRRPIEFRLDGLNLYPS